MTVPTPAEPTVGESAPGADATPPPVRLLPPSVRRLVLTLASDALEELAAGEVPAPLRAFARFRSERRAVLAATPIAVTLERDPAFRQQVAARVRTALPELAAAVVEGAVPPAADPVDVAAVVYLLRAADWESALGALLDQVREQEGRSTARARDAEAEQGQALLRAQHSALQEQAGRDLARTRAELVVAREEVGDLRRRLGAERTAAAQAGRETTAALEAREVAFEQALAARAASDAELRRVRARLVDAEATAEAARRAAREGRSMGDARLRLLLDTVLEGTQGLRRELALAPTELRPADAVAAVAARSEGPHDVGARALEESDPGLLDQLLALPQVHLVVDGYNVTKTGFPDVPLHVQRHRLVTGLAALAARTRAEVTCCFDGADLDGPVPTTAARGVRVLFSRAEETADDLIRRLVGAEPLGRPVVVVSSDREVAEDVRRAGARPVPALALVRRLGRS